MEWLNEEWQQEEDYYDDNDMHAVEALHHHNHDAPHHHHHGAAVYRSPVALDRRSTAGSSTSNGLAPSTASFRSSCASYRDVHPAAPSSPSHAAYPQSSPSVVSSLNYSSVPGGWSPLYRQPSSTPSQCQVAATSTTAASISRDRGARNDLARRLTLLAQRLTCGDDVDELALVGQLEQMEKAVSPPSSPNPRRRQLPHRHSSGLSDPQSPTSPPPQSRSETASVLGSPVSLIRSQFSDLSLASLRERERERDRIDEEEREEARARTGIAEAEAKQLIAEASKLNEELSQVAENLKARQEEMDHINNLLVERAERAAERIVFLQNRVAYLERELDENDDELQHLRICLKGVEIQLPPNPDRELQRCINVFKEDFRELKRNRAHRASVASAASSQTLLSSPTSPTPATPKTPNPGSGGSARRTPSYKLYTTPRNDMK